MPHWTKLYSEEARALVRSMSREELELGYLEGCEAYMAEYSPRKDTDPEHDDFSDDNFMTMAEIIAEDIEELKKRTQWGVD